MSGKDQVCKRSNLAYRVWWRAARGVTSLVALLLSQVLPKHEPTLYLQTGIWNHIVHFVVSHWCLSHCFHKSAIYRKIMYHAMQETNHPAQCEMDLKIFRLSLWRRQIKQKENSSFGIMVLHVWKDKLMYIY